jgi:membrane associated rhomboid family serine protease
MKPEGKAILNSFIPGTVFVAILTVIHYFFRSDNPGAIAFGLMPRNVDHLAGILTFPLIHEDTGHLYSNAVPLFILMALLHYIYKPLFWPVFILNWLLSGAWLWLGGRPSFHIGASGLLYGLASFLFFSGLWRWERRTMAVSLIVVFLYGGMIWGLFPFLKDVSWEGHIFGGMSGLLLSWVYRKREPQRPVYEWETDTGEEEPVDDGLTDITEPEDEPLESEGHETNDPILPSAPRIRYDYKEKGEDDQDRKQGQ